MKESEQPPALREFPNPFPIDGLSPNQLPIGPISEERAILLAQRDVAQENDRAKGINDVFNQQREEHEMPQLPFVPRVATTKEIQARAQRHSAISEEIGRSVVNAPREAIVTKEQ
jgi:hypothetical protein